MSDVLDGAARHNRHKDQKRKRAEIYKRLDQATEYLEYRKRGGWGTPEGISRAKAQRDQALIELSELEGDTRKG